MSHIVAAYDSELEALGRKIAEMAASRRRCCPNRWMPCRRSTSTSPARWWPATPRLDLLQREIEESSIGTIARRQPMAVDLREIIAAVRISGDLERVGDLAKNIAKRTVKIATEPRVPRATIGLKHMNEMAATQLKDVLDAYAQRDIERAQAVWIRDGELDALEDSVFRDLLTFMMEDPRNIFLLHPPAVLFEEHRAGRRPRHQPSPRRSSTSSPAARCRSTGRRTAARPAPSRRPSPNRNVARRKPNS